MAEREEERRAVGVRQRRGSLRKSSTRKQWKMYRRAKVATRNNKLQPQVPNVEPN